MRNASWSFLIYYQWNFSWIYRLIQVVKLTGSELYYLAIWVSPERAKEQMPKSQRETGEEPKIALPQAGSSGFGERALDVVWGILVLDTSVCVRRDF